MYFSTTAFVALLSATAAVAAPAANPEPIGNKAVEYKKQYIKDCKKDFDYKWSHDGWKSKEKLFYFDAEYVVKATPDQVINPQGVPAPGQPGAKGIYKYGINIAENTICYNITLSGVTGDYQSPAKTATHIHEGAKGKAGPPRLAFPNPTGPDERRTSYGCLTGPFITGVLAPNNGPDTGTGFHVRQIVENPSNFFTDSHTTQFVAGAVRGQLS